MILQKLITQSISELRRSGIMTADIDVRAVLKYVLDQDNEYLLTHNSDLISNAQYQKFRRLIIRRKKGEPLAYLTGHKEFYGLNFKVNKNVLIPRPETETLVDHALQILSAKNYKLKTIIDIGTGSGCIAISLIQNLKARTQNIKTYAVDISQKALKVAKQNAKNHDLYDNIRFLSSDLFSNQKLPKNFDLIIANLPYLKVPNAKIKYSQPSQIGLNFEPQVALFAKDDGFYYIEQLIRLLPQKLKPGGAALIEASESHKNRIFNLCAKFSLKCESVSNINNYQGFFKIVYQ